MRLNRPDIRHIVRAVQGGAGQRADDIRLRMEDLADAFWLEAAPARTCNEIIAGIEPCGPYSDIREILREQIYPLDDIVTILRHSRHAKHPGFGAQVEPCPGIRRVVVRRDDVMISRGEGLRVVAELTKSADIFRRAFVSTACLYQV